MLVARYRFHLLRMSFGRKSVRIFILALLDMLFVSIWCIEFLRGLLMAPVLAGIALGIMMLIFIAINAIVMITGLNKQELNKGKKFALSILLGGAVLCALLTLFSPEWVDVLVLDAATIVAIMLFKSQKIINFFITYHNNAPKLKYKVRFDFPVKINDNDLPSTTVLVDFPQIPRPGDCISSEDKAFAPLFKEIDEYFRNTSSL